MTSHGNYSWNPFLTNLVEKEINTVTFRQTFQRLIVSFFHLFMKTASTNEAKILQMATIIMISCNFVPHKPFTCPNGNLIKAKMTSCFIKLKLLEFETIFLSSLFNFREKRFFP